MRAALDTNILVYAEGVGDAGREQKAQAVIAAAPTDALVVPVQVLGELYNVLTRKARRSGEAARRAVATWADQNVVTPTDAMVMGEAVELAGAHQLAIWDAVVLAAAAQASCDILLTEDLQDGFHWRGVTVVNPFAEPMSPLLDAFLDQGR